MKKKEKKQEQTNPLHREYGLLSNARYILRYMIDTEKRFLLLIPLGVICAPLMQYLWTFISKFVIDMITGDAGWQGLLWLMAVFAMVQMSSTMLSSYYYSEVWWRFINTRFVMMTVKNARVMSIIFEHLEDPDVMDCYQKASNAAGGNSNGIEGMMREMVNFLMSLAVVGTGLVILGTMNPLIMLLLTALGAVTYVINLRAGITAKHKIWDPLATWWRKHNYTLNLCTDFSAAKDIRMFGIKDWLADKFADLQKTRYKAQKDSAKIWLVAGVLSNVMYALSTAAVYAWLIYSLVQGELSIGNFSLYLGTSLTFYGYIRQLLQSVEGLMMRSREVDDWRSFLDFDGVSDEGIPLPPQDKYEFEFRNVSFKYPKAENYALKNLSITLKAGERLAVVGLNGAGKSTFIKLLLRLYEPTEGEILLNGVNVKEYSRRSYYAIFAPIFQEVELFAFPLAENVSMQSPSNTDKERAERCLISAGFEEKLKELPNGVSTEMLKVIYDDGVDLSGGEKQKLALARALYKDAPVAVLDEPTAALDALAESKLYNDFDALIGGKTAVYISHRLSSTQFCNNVAMFKDGELAEYGTHRSLLEKGGEYAEMFRIQAQYYVENPEESEAAADVRA